MFKNRFDAAQRLAGKLKKYQNKDAIVLAIPRGGIEVGYVLATQLSLPLNVILIKKLGHPANNEMAIGAVSIYGYTVNSDNSITKEYIRQETLRLHQELLQKTKIYEEIVKPAELKNKTVILTDDGIATGFTIISAIDIIKRNGPARIVVAIPVAPKDTIEKISMLVDEVVCERTPFAFHAVGEFYESFNQMSDEEAISLFQKANKNHIET